MTYPPEVQVPEDWEPLALPFNIASGRDFPPDSNGVHPLRMAFFRRRKDDSLVGKVWAGPSMEGPPGHVHGGITSYILDEAMGSSVWLRGYPCVALHLEMDFHAMTPLGKDLDVEAWIERVEERRILTRGRVFLGDTVFSEAQGVFHRLSEKRVAAFVEAQGIQLDLGQYRFPPAITP